MQKKRKRYVQIPSLKITFGKAVLFELPLHMLIDLSLESEEREENVLDEG